MLRFLKKIRRQTACGLNFVYTKELSIDCGNNAGTNGTATFTDSETKTFFDSDRGDQFNVDGDVVARHSHFSAFRKR